MFVVIEKILWRDGACQFRFWEKSFLTLWDGDCEFLGCRKAFFLHRGGASNGSRFFLGIFYGFFGVFFMVFWPSIAKNL